MGGICKGICPDYEFDKNDYPKIEEFHGYKVFHGGHTAIYDSLKKDIKFWTRCRICCDDVDGWHSHLLKKHSDYLFRKHMVLMTDEHGARPQIPDKRELI